MYVKEKKVDCGNYREVDILPRTESADKAVKGKRGRRRKVTPPKQKNLNDKNARRYLTQLANGNFSEDDYHVTMTYSDKYLPESVEEAERTVTNYLRRIAYRRKRLELEPLKYILVTEYKTDAVGKTLTRIHHHIIMNEGISRDDLELMWTHDRISWKKAREGPKYRKNIHRLGFVNVDRLQPNENGVEALCNYLLKEPCGKKRWSSSRNLIRPVELAPAQKKYTRSQIDRLAKSPDSGMEYFRKKFPKYEIVSCEAVFYEETGWHIYLKMWKKKRRLE